MHCKTAFCASRTVAMPGRWFRDRLTQVLVPAPSVGGKCIGNAPNGGDNHESQSHNQNATHGFESAGFSRLGEHTVRRWGERERFEQLPVIPERLQDHRACHLAIRPVLPRVLHAASADTSKSPIAIL